VKLSQVIAALEKDPKLICNAIDSFGDKHELSINEHGYLRYRKTRGDGYYIDPAKHSGGQFNGNLNLEYDWQIVPQPVSVWEALKAWAEDGKEIRCKPSGTSCGHDECTYKSGDCGAISRHCIIAGTWYIPEEQTID